MFPLRSPSKTSFHESSISVGEIVAAVMFWGNPDGAVKQEGGKKYLRFLKYTDMCTDTQSHIHNYTCI